MSLVILSGLILLRRKGWDLCFSCFAVFKLKIHIAIGVFKAIKNTFFFYKSKNRFYGRINDLIKLFILYHLEFSISPYISLLKFIIKPINI